MWNPILLQACLRLNKQDIPNDLVIGNEYFFEKKWHRLYQIKVPMDLRESNRDFVCRIIILEITIWNWITKWKYMPVKLFSEDDKNIITKTYVSDENIELILKQKRLN